MDVLGVVLAGGRSTRMGREKATMPFGNRALGSWPVSALREAGLDVVVVAKRPLELGAPVWLEPAEPVHPLLGVLTALERRRGPVLTVPCDMPYVSGALLARLAGTPAPAAAHPLVAHWPLGAVPTLREAVAAGTSVTAVLERLAPTAVPAPAGELRNLNRPQDVEGLPPPRSPPPSSTGAARP